MSESQRPARPKLSLFRKSPPPPPAPPAPRESAAGSEGARPA